MSRLVLVCGVPGSGKSTFARTIFVRERIFDFDLKFPHWAHSKQSVTPSADKRVTYKEAHDLLFAQVKESLSNGESVVVVDVFNLSSMRKLYRDHCSEKQIPFCCVYIEHPPMQMVLQRRIHLIEAERLVKLVQTFEIPADCTETLTIPCTFDFNLSDQCRILVESKQNAFLQSVQQKQQEDLLKQMQKLELKNSNAHSTNIQLCQYVHHALENYSVSKIQANFPCIQRIFYSNQTSIVELANRLRLAKHNYLHSFYNQPFNQQIFESFIEVA